MDINFTPILVATFVSLVVGFIWYNPKVFGTIWMNETGMTEEKAQKGNMLKIFGLTIVYSFLIAFLLSPMVIHQFGAMGMIGGDPSKIDPSSTYFAFMKQYENAFRTYQHGALHGCMVGVLFVMPITAINSLFEQKSWKYMLVTGGFWVVTLTLMGAIICGWK